MPREWVEVPESEEAESGATYRLTIITRAPFSTALANSIGAAIRFGTGVRNILPWTSAHEKMEIVTVYFGDPESYAIRDGGRYGEWPILVEMQKKSEGTILAILYGLVALILVGTFGVLVAGRKWERLVDSTSEAATNFLNPGLVLGAFIIGAAALKGR